MGFTCFICKEPFDENGPPAHHKGGGGDVGGQGAKAATATKCGHLFHSICLKISLEKQSGNAWVVKSCPVCRTSLGLKDIIPVRACHTDASTSKYPSVEDVLKAKNQLQQQNSDLIQRLEEMCLQNRKLHQDQESIREERQTYELRYEQLVRLNAIHKSDIERYRAEMERLKNIIITLTAKLTGNFHQEFNNNNNNNNGLSVNVGLPFNDDHIHAQGQGYPNCDLPIGVGVHLSKAGHGHPPGLMHPHQIPLQLQENPLPEIHSPSPSPVSPPGEGLPSHNHNSVMMTTDLLKTKLSLRLPTPPGGKPLQHNSDLFNFTRENNDFVSNSEMIWEGQLQESPVFSKPVAMTHSAPKGLNRLSSSSTTTAAGMKTNNGSETSPQGTASENAPKKQGTSASAVQPTPANGVPDSEGLKNKDEPEVDSSSKWHEKKSKRRSTTTSNRGGSSRSRGSRNSRSKNEYVPPPDKKLYGSFLCPTCNAKWGSSQSYHNKPQTCRYCDTEVYPFTQGPILSKRQLELNSLAEKESAADATKEEKKK